MLWFRGSLLLEDSKFAHTRSGVSVCTVMAFIAVYLSHIGLFNFQGTKYKILRFAVVFVSIIRYNFTEVQFLSVRTDGKLTVLSFISVRIEVKYMEYEKYTEQYEFGGLNDNKKITAVFDHYEVENVRGEMYIGARLTEGESPKLQEGYGINGQQLWVSLQNLYLDIYDKDDNEAAQIIISWCRENVQIL